LADLVGQEKHDSVMGGFFATLGGLVILETKSPDVRKQDGIKKTQKAFVEMLCTRMMKQKRVKGEDTMCLRYSMEVHQRILDVLVRVSARKVEQGYMEFVSFSSTLPFGNEPAV